jgi:hypothetical protein
MNYCIALFRLLKGEGAVGIVGSVDSGGPGYRGCRGFRSFRERILMVTTDSGQLTVNLS